MKKLHSTANLKPFAFVYLHLVTFGKLRLGTETSSVSVLESAKMDSTPWKLASKFGLQILQLIQHTKVLNYHPVNINKINLIN